MEIYEAKSSQEIVEQQLYTLTDRGGRRLALRPEMTPSVARIIAGWLQFPVRWYSHPTATVTSGPSAAECVSTGRSMSRCSDRTIRRVRSSSSS